MALPVLLVNLGVVKLDIAFAWSVVRFQTPNTIKLHGPTQEFQLMVMATLNSCGPALLLTIRAFSAATLQISGI